MISRTVGIGLSPGPLLALLLLALTIRPAFALTLSGERVPLLAEQYSFLEDPAATLTFADVINSDKFEPVPAVWNPSFGYSASAFWFRAVLKNSGGRDWLLELPSPTLDYVSVYLRSLRDGSLLAQYHTGDRYRFADRPVRGAHFVFPFSLTEGEQYELYLRIKTEDVLTLSPILWRSDIYQEHARTHYMLASVYLGILLALLGYNLILFFSLRDKTYILYVLFILAILLHQGSLDGYAYEYLWPSLPGWANISSLIGFHAIGLFGAIFSRSFLDTRTHAPLIDGVILAFAFLFASLMISAAFIPYHLNAVITSLVSVNFSVVTVFASATFLRRGIRMARYFLFAWALLVAGIILVAADSLGWVPVNGITLHGSRIGSLLALLLLSYALSERILVVRREKEAAESAVRAKDEFLATVSHEIRTPLTVLLGSVGLLLDSGLQAEQSTLARSAQRSGEQLLTLLNDLIDLSRIASGKLQLEERVFETGALMRDVFELMEVPARDKGLTIDIRLAFERLYLRSDPGRIRQVLLNLVFNAVKFTEIGKVYLEAMIIERQGDGRVTIRFSVVDTGRGISPADQERMFHPFSQIESGAAAKRGSGLGLAISRRLVEALGGTIRVFSRPDQGSRFWFDLELMTAPEPQNEVDRQCVRSSISLHLLLVEDVYESRTVLAAQLQKAGYSVTAVDSGKAALETVQHQSIDAVLMDLHMPEMDGYTTTKRLRALKPRPDIPVFALTASIGTDIHEACIAAGMQGVVAKPLQVAELHEKLFAVFTPATISRTTLVVEKDPPALLDEKAMAERLSLLGTEATVKVIRAFMDVAEKRALAVRNALHEGNAAGLAEAAHVLRGSAGAVCMPVLLELAGEIERAALRSFSEAQALADRIPEILHASIAALHEWCKARDIQMPASFTEFPNTP